MDIIKSVRKLQSDEEMVIGRFYTRFLNRDPRINAMFGGVDLPQQSVMLTTALNIVELNYSAQSPVARESLRMLGKKHRAIGATPDLFPIFRDCLLETLAEYHGTDWDEELQRQWDESLQAALETMLEAYD